MVEAYRRGQALELPINECGQILHRMGCPSAPRCPGELALARQEADTTAGPPFGEIAMRTRYRDFPGRWVYHCHILLHEDKGMMGTVRALA